VFGRDREAPPLPEPEPDVTPLEALAAAILPALERPPCVVSFSGGRDSSAVLAVAAEAARRHGLPLPVPVTVRFKEAPGANEPDWQELVVRHLNLPEWQIVDVDDELDLVGPYAARVLRRHGVLHPPHAGLFELLLEHAAGGSLLTGFAGDAVFGRWPLQHLAEVRAGRARPEARDLVLLGYVASPAPVRRAALRVRAPAPPWLRPSARRRFARERAASVSAPVRWRAHLGQVVAGRAHAASAWTIALLARDRDATTHHPLADRRFLAALAQAGGDAGLGGRTAAMRSLFGDLLPDELLARDDKARFHYAYFREPSRAFARAYRGGGLDLELVDPEVLRATWLALMPHGASALPLQAAWLASAAREVEQPAAGIRQSVPGPRSP
jgi:asparagine synthase (glutamine-hydrolysing)